MPHCLYPQNAGHEAQAEQYGIKKRKNFQIFWGHITSGHWVVHTLKQQQAQIQIEKFLEGVVHFFILWFVILQNYY